MKAVYTLLLIGFSLLSTTAYCFTINYTTTDESCVPGNDGAINLTVIGGTSPYTYSWSPNVGGGNSAVNLSAGVYNVTVTDALNSTQSASIRVNSAPIPSIVVNATNPTCPGDADGMINLNLSPGQAPYTFIWSNSSTSQNQTGLSAGTYSVTIIDAYGCTTTLSANMVDPLPIINTVTQNGLLLTADQPNASYQWLDCTTGYSPISGASSQTYNAPINGIFAVEIQLNGCKDTSRCVSTLTIGMEQGEQKSNSFQIYPNPSRGDLILEGEQLIGERLRIFDLGGKIIFEETLYRHKNLIKLDQLPRGIYFLEVNNIKRKIVMIE